MLINPSDSLLTFWKRLSQVSSLYYVASSLQGVKKTRGTVVCKAPSDSILIFQEKGQWLMEGEEGIKFTNRLRWQLDSSSIRLEHVRYDENNPTFLFQFAAVSSHRLEALESHLCSKDTYQAYLTMDAEKIELHISVTGPTKQDTLIYSYR